jgi:hypothetical protein
LRAIDLGGETAGVSLHTAEATGPVRLFSTVSTRPGGRLRQPPSALPLYVSDEILKRSQTGVVLRSLSAGPMTIL